MTGHKREDFELLDKGDPLASFHDRFELPAGIVYLDGNSLGARPKAALARLTEVVASQWGDGLIRSWNDAGWFDLPTSLGRKIATLIGASDDEVVVTDSTGINLFKAFSCALQLKANRKVVVVEADDFPTNHYVLQGLVHFLTTQYEVRVVHTDQLQESITEEVALVCLTQVNYRSGRLLDMSSITRAIHQAGALVVWDLSHSAGVVELFLDDWEVDFAVGCTYKYLNGGPGSPAYIYMNARHHNKAQQPLTGWWGHEDPFGFEQTYKPARGITQLLTGTQPIISLALAEVGIDIALQADIRLVREKSIQLTRYFIELIDEQCPDFGFKLASPREPTERGSQVSLQHEHAYPIMQALIEDGVIGDFRAPDCLRFGFSPLYTRYVDVWDAVKTLYGLMESARWKEQKYQTRRGVT